ncbi:MAG: formyltransferase family protein [Phycisphaerae bacterium]|jgi:methionyl-tRNA formyltransferase
MNIVILTNDNFFSFTVLKDFLQKRKNDIVLIVFSSALIGKRGTIASVKWLLKNTGFRHTVFKLSVYGIFKFMKVLCKLLPFIPNHYSSFLWATLNDIDYVVAPDVNDNRAAERIESVKPDLIISVSMNQIVKKQTLQMPPQGCINVHCAPLPRYGGMSPYVWTLANNETQSAATIHYMEEGLDEGDIIVQQNVPVVKNDSAFALFYRCCLQAANLLIKVVDDIETHTATSYKQDLSQKTYFSWPNKKCMKELHKNGYQLAKISDFTCAIFNQRPRIK